MNRTGVNCFALLIYIGLIISSSGNLMALERERVIEFFRNGPSNKPGWHQVPELSYSIQLSSQTGVGPHVVLVGATHGDEPSGVEALYLIIQDFLKSGYRPSRGKITFALGNPEAYERDQNYYQFNLNRIFTDDLLATHQHTYEAERAREFQRFFASQHSDQQNIAGILDIHAVTADDSKMLIYYLEEDKPAAVNERIRKIAATISPLGEHNVPIQKTSPGMLINQARKENVPLAFLVETGNRRSRNSIKSAIEHSINFLAHFRMVSPEKIRTMEKSGFYQPEPPSSCITIYTDFDVIRPSPDSGFEFLDPDMQSYYQLKSGQAYGKDRAGNLYHCHRDCFIIMPAAWYIPQHPGFRRGPEPNDAGFLDTKEIVSRQDIVNAQHQ